MNKTFLTMLLGSAFTAIVLSGCTTSNFYQNSTNNNSANVQSDGNYQQNSNNQTNENPNIPSNNTLNLSGENLTQLPSYVTGMTNLRKLDVSDNRIDGALPAEIRHLQKLEVLDASNNQMTGVPAEIGQLSKLKILDLSNNQLTGLPYELGNLKNLESFDISGNNYSQHDLNIIKQGIPQAEIVTD